MIWTAAVATSSMNRSRGRLKHTIHAGGNTEGQIILDSSGTGYFSSRLLRFPAAERKTETF
jgi:hypothetical protein